MVVVSCSVGWSAGSVRISGVGERPGCSSTRYGSTRSPGRFGLGRLTGLVTRRGRRSMRRGFAPLRPRSCEDCRCDHQLTSR
jgi:hypothetical protein